MGQRTMAITSSRDGGRESGGARSGSWATGITRGPVALALGALVTGALAMSGSSPHQVALTNASVPPTALGASVDSMSAFNAETGQFGHMAVVRDYNSGLPKAWSVTPGAGTTDEVVSFKALPQSILSGHDDAALRTWFKTAPRNHITWWSYFHEPEDNIRAGEFTAAEYRAAWAHIAKIADGVANPSLRATLILMAYTLSPASHRNFFDYYPGASVINTLGWDAYPQPNNTPVAPSRFMAPAVAFSKHLGKPFGFAEFGMTSPVGRPAWLGAVGPYLESSGAAFGTYFNAFGCGSYTLCDSASIHAWRTVVQS